MVLQSIFQIQNKKWFFAEGGWQQFTKWSGQLEANPYGDHPPVFRVLGLDPGKVNFAWSVTDHVISDDLKMLSRVVVSGLVPSVPTSLKEDLSKLTDKSTRFLRELLVRYMPDVVIAERFMASGLRVGTTIEIANVVSGIMAYMCWDTNKPMYMTPAVTWKGAINRALGYKEALEDVYRACAATPHQVDASLMGCWQASTLLDCEPFESVSDDETLSIFLESLELTSEQRLRGIRG